MSVSRDDVERMATLAALTLDPDTLTELTDQIGRILGYVAQLDRGDLAVGSSYTPGPSRAPLRDDEAVNPAGAVDLAAMSPRFEDGFVVVPPVAAGDDDG